jgi:hypothetical protein
VNGRDRFGDLGIRGENNKKLIGYEGVDWIHVAEWSFMEY